MRVPLSAPCEAWQRDSSVRLSPSKQPLPNAGGKLRIGDALLSVNGCMGNAKLLSKILQEAPFKVSLQLERTAAREGAASTSTRGNGSTRRSHNWVNTKMSWWSSIQGQFAPQEAWMQLWLRSASDTGPSRAVDSVGRSLEAPEAQPIVPSVPSAEMRIGSFGLFQLRREVLRR